ncbi:ComEC/Rec2 family competence protein [Clavibacter zhangzhiyongii]|uniref:ComEC/Rec2 family competence protein n=1 Tax=Clavibacter zhangzhiyongii TaxID=2768071 RepID=UPI0019575277|nr:ComEC/Rec2 family competence protein [Clavibacter zhangzhiyongii]MBM7025680.1 ComEC/Rec2 family competence protein [Clavibacter zhangzhiyongii]
MTAAVRWLGGGDPRGRGADHHPHPAVDLRLALPAGIGWAVTAAVIGVRGASAVGAIVAAALAVVSVAAATAGVAAARRHGEARSGSGTGTGGTVGRRPPGRLRRRAPRRLVRAAAGVAVSAAVTAMLLGATAAQETGRHPAELEEAARTHGTVIADVVVDEPPVPVAAHGSAQHGGGGSGSSSPAPSDGEPASASPTTHAAARVRIAGHLTAIHSGREVRGHAVDTTTALPAPVPVVVFAARPDHPSALGVGAVVRLSAAVRSADPGDRAAYLLQARGRLDATAAPPGALAVADGLRQGLMRAAAELPGPGASLLPGLAIGDVSAVSPELAQTMKDSSLTHLTAVSGANCAVIVGLVLALSAAAGLRRPARAVAALAALAAFVVLVTPQPSVLRAAVMAAVLIVSTAGGRPARGLPALAVAVVVLLTADPRLARDLGFTLSVLATAGLLVLAPPLAERLARRMPRRLADALAIPVAAQVACQPVLLVLQPGLPVHGVVANVLAEPAAAPATVAGLVACVLLPIWPAAGDLLVRLAWLPASWIAAVASVMSGLPAGRIPWPTGLAGVVALAVATALVVAALARAPASSPSPASRTPAAHVPPDG